MNLPVIIALSVSMTAQGARNGSSGTLTEADLIALAVALLVSFLCAVLAGAVLGDGLEDAAGVGAIVFCGMLLVSMLAIMAFKILGWL
jgi:hypothetical protein